jgi:hypothetical protein
LDIRERGDGNVPQVVLAAHASRFVSPGRLDMLKQSGFVLALLLVPGFALAQEGFHKNFSAADFEKIIKEDLNKDFEKKEGKIGYEYDIKDTPYFALFNKRDRFLLFFVRDKAGTTTLQQINDWNRDAVYSRTYLTGQFLIFEVPYSFAAGTNANTVANYYRLMEKEYAGFRKVMSAGN